jgi:PilZ domain-containing protein
MGCHGPLTAGGLWSEAACNTLTDNNTSERRASTRRAADWRVLFGPPGELSAGFLADMSPIGVSILSEKQYPVGTEIEVHFGVEESELRGKFRMHAIVRHCGKGRIGVHFVNVDAAQRDHWWKIMRSEF